MRVLGISLAVFFVGFSATSLPAGGLIPDRVNQLIIQGRFDRQPAFIAVFSAEPLATESGRTLHSLSARELQDLTTTPDRVVLRLYGKPVSKSGRIDYFFGTAHDKDQPWNNGTDFRWEDWERHSADVWDHIAIMLAPGYTGRVAVIDSVTIRRGGKFLYESRAKKSYPNGRPLRAGLFMKPFSLVPRRNGHPVLNLSQAMAAFRREYYELGNNPILHAAYADLGQTEKRKYARRGANWCSEFATFVYREHGLDTPDPNAGDVHFRNLRAAFEKSGRVYPMREVMTWSDAEKLKRITPGSFVSILIGDSTHSLIFTTWVLPEAGQITKYAAISGNNKGMVWSHDPLALPTAEQLRGMTAEQLADYDVRVYFGVPDGN